MGTAAFSHGAGSDVGIVPRVASELFTRLEQQREACPGGQFMVRVTFLEIYGEDMRDLLTLGTLKPVTIRETEGGVAVIGATERVCTCTSEVLAALEEGGLCRTTASTAMNAHSSRSHAVFSIILEQRLPYNAAAGPAATPAAATPAAATPAAATPAAATPAAATPAAATPAAAADGAPDSGDATAADGKPPADGAAAGAAAGSAAPPASPDALEVRVSKLHIADLAGSERLKKTQATGRRMQEGININLGLLSLSKCIELLADEDKRRRAHIPYRDSKLTRLLQDSLGGNACTLMIACVSPSESNFEETLSTMRYSARARNIKNKPVINRDANASQVAALKAEIEALRAQLLQQGGDGAGGGGLLLGAPLAGSLGFRGAVDLLRTPGPLARAGVSLQSLLEATGAADVADIINRLSAMRQATQEADSLRARAEESEGEVLRLLGELQRVRASLDSEAEGRIAVELHMALLEEALLQRGLAPDALLTEAEAAWAATSSGASGAAASGGASGAGTSSDGAASNPSGAGASNAVSAGPGAASTAAISMAPPQGGLVGVERLIRRVADLERQLREAQDAARDAAAWHRDADALLHLGLGGEPSAASLALMAGSGRRRLSHGGIGEEAGAASGLLNGSTDSAVGGAGAGAAPITLERAEAALAEAGVALTDDDDSTASSSSSSGSGDRRGSSEERDAFAEDLSHGFDFDNEGGAGGDKAPAGAGGGAPLRGRHRRHRRKGGAANAISRASLERLLRGVNKRLVVGAETEDEGGGAAGERDEGAAAAADDQVAAAGAAGDASGGVSEATPGDGSGAALSDGVSTALVAPAGAAADTGAAGIGASSSSSSDAASLRALQRAEAAHARKSAAMERNHASIGDTIAAKEQLVAALLAKNAEFDRMRGLYEARMRSLAGTIAALSRERERIQHEMEAARSAAAAAASGATAAADGADAGAGAASSSSSGVAGAPSGGATGAALSDSDQARISAPYEARLASVNEQLQAARERARDAERFSRIKERTAAEIRRLQGDLTELRRARVAQLALLRAEKQRFAGRLAEREREMARLQREDAALKAELGRIKGELARKDGVLRRKVEEAALAARRLRGALVPPPPHGTAAASAGAAPAMGGGAGPAAGGVARGVRGGPSDSRPTEGSPQPALAAGAAAPSAPPHPSTPVSRQTRSRTSLSGVQTDGVGPSGSRAAPPVASPLARAGGGFAGARSRASLAGSPPPPSPLLPPHAAGDASGASSRAASPGAVEARERLTTSSRNAAVAAVARSVRAVRRKTRLHTGEVLVSRQGGLRVASLVGAGSPQLAGAEGASGSAGAGGVGASVAAGAASADRGGRTSADSSPARQRDSASRLSLSVAFRRRGASGATPGGSAAAAAASSSSAGSVAAQLQRRLEEAVARIAEKERRVEELERRLRSRDADVRMLEQLMEQREALKASLFYGETAASSAAGGGAAAAAAGGVNGTRARDGAVQQRRRQSGALQQQAALQPQPHRHSSAELEAAARAAGYAGLDLQLIEDINRFFEDAQEGQTGQTQRMQAAGAPQEAAGVQAHGDVAAAGGGDDGSLPTLLPGVDGGTSSGTAAATTRSGAAAGSTVPGRPGPVAVAVKLTDLLSPVRAGGAEGGLTGRAGASRAHSTGEAEGPRDGRLSPGASAAAAASAATSLSGAGSAVLSLQRRRTLTEVEADTLRQIEEAIETAQARLDFQDDRILRLAEDDEDLRREIQMAAAAAANTAANAATGFGGGSGGGGKGSAAGPAALTSPERGSVRFASAPLAASAASLPASAMGRALEEAIVSCEGDAAAAAAAGGRAASGGPPESLSSGGGSDSASATGPATASSAFREPAGGAFRSSRDAREAAGASAMGEREGAGGSRSGPVAVTLRTADSAFPVFSTASALSADAAATAAAATDSGGGAAAAGAGSGAGASGRPLLLPAPSIASLLESGASALATGVPLTGIEGGASAVVSDAASRQSADALPSAAAGESPALAAAAGGANAALASQVLFNMVVGMKREERLRQHASAQLQLRVEELTTALEASEGAVKALRLEHERRLAEARREQAQETDTLLRLAAATAGPTGGGVAQAAAAPRDASARSGASGAVDGAAAASTAAGSSFAAAGHASHGGAAALSAAESVISPADLMQMLQQTRGRFAELQGQLGARDATIAALEAERERLREEVNRMATLALRGQEQQYRLVSREAHNGSGSGNSTGGAVPPVSPASASRGVALAAAGAAAGPNSLATNGLPPSRPLAAGQQRSTRARPTVGGNLSGAAPRTEAGDAPTAGAIPVAGGAAAPQLIASASAVPPSAMAVVGSACSPPAAPFARSLGAGSLAGGSVAGAAGEGAAEGRDAVPAGLAVSGSNAPRLLGPPPAAPGVAAESGGAGRRGLRLGLASSARGSRGSGAGSDSEGSETCYDPFTIQGSRYQGSEHSTAAGCGLFAAGPGRGVQQTSSGRGQQQSAPVPVQQPQPQQALRRIGSASAASAGGALTARPALASGAPRGCAAGPGNDGRPHSARDVGPAGFPITGPAPAALTAGPSGLPPTVQSRPRGSLRVGPATAAAIGAVSAGGVAGGGSPSNAESSGAGDVGAQLAGEQQPAAAVLAPAPVNRRASTRGLGLHLSTAAAAEFASAAAAATAAAQLSAASRAGGDGSAAATGDGASRSSTAASASSTTDPSAPLSGGAADGAPAGHAKAFAWWSERGIQPVASFDAVVEPGYSALSHPKPPASGAPGAVAAAVEMVTGVAAPVIATVGGAGSAAVAPGYAAATAAASARVRSSGIGLGGHAAREGGASRLSLVGSSAAPPPSAGGATPMFTISLPAYTGESTPTVMSGPVAPASLGGTGLIYTSRAAVAGAPAVAEPPARAFLPDAAEALQGPGRAAESGGAHLHRPSLSARFRSGSELLQQAGSHGGEAADATTAPGASRPSAAVDGAALSPSAAADRQGIDATEEAGADGMQGAAAGLLPLPAANLASPPADRRGRIGSGSTAPAGPVLKIHSLLADIVMSPGGGTNNSASGTSVAAQTIGGAVAEAGGFTAGILPGRL
jgi:hypothetical protein